jgi:hypothetical protein
MSGTASRDVPQGFSGMHSLQGGDARKLNLVAHGFHRSVLMDFACLEKAAQNGDWPEVSMLGRCIQLPITTPQC